MVLDWLLLGLVSKKWMLVLELVLVELTQAPQHEAGHTRACLIPTPSKSLLVEVLLLASRGNDSEEES